MPGLLAAKDNWSQEFLGDPSLTVACVLLIVVSIGWVVITRIIARRFKKALLRADREARRTTTDIWSTPP